MKRFVLWYLRKISLSCCGKYDWCAMCPFSYDDDCKCSIIKVEQGLRKIDE